MKNRIAWALMLLLPTFLQAQTVDKSVAKPVVAKPAVKVSASSPAHRPPAKPTAQPVIEAPLSSAEQAIAERVHVGLLPCELGASIHLESDAKSPGYFNVHGKGFHYRMRPVETSTGAIRLEDQAGGAVWLQLANKSMLMDQKQGKRLADECASPMQVAAAEALKRSPAPSLIDMPAGAR